MLYSLRVTKTVVDISTIIII